MAKSGPSSFRRVLGICWPNCSILQMGKVSHSDSIHWPFSCEALSCPPFSKAGPLNSEDFVLGHHYIMANGWACELAGLSDVSGPCAQPRGHSH